ncbi:MAG: cobalamin B12-binding domain-containing protein [Paucibacter sp.]|nr:cobalamin B12-binding domain-containing protein [Roseateles sp.]
MAGWTINRLAKRQQAPLPMADGAGLCTDGDALRHAEPLNLTLTETLSRRGADQPGKARQLSFDEDRLRPAPPRLVSCNAAQDHLSRIVELEIIPRLMLMHSAQPLVDRPPLPSLVLTVEHVDTLAHMAAEGEADAACAYVRTLLDAGASQEQVFLDLLAPCARQLGQMWNEDVYDFSQVTVALWRLQRVLHEQSQRFQQISRPDGDSHRALLAAVPGAQHTFGVVMAAEFFSRAGWDVVCEPKASWSDLQDRLSLGWFDMFGLSIATGDSIPQVASAILKLREASANPQVFVMVGGPMALELPELAALCGADAMACEACAAVDTANAGVAQRLKQA